MKSKREYSTLRKSAKDELCTLNFSGCTTPDNTTVLAHLRMFGGGGMGLKPHDMEAVYACFNCHNKLDGRIPYTFDADVDYYVARALIKTHRRMIEKGLIRIKGDD